MKIRFQNVELVMKTVDYCNLNEEGNYTYEHVVIYLNMNLCVLKIRING